MEVRFGATPKQQRPGAARPLPIIPASYGLGGGVGRGLGVVWGLGVGVGLGGRCRTTERLRWQLASESCRGSAAVAVGLDVGVAVAVAVGVDVGVGVAAVAVAVAVGVGVGVATVGVGVGVGVPAGRRKAYTFIIPGDIDASTSCNASGTILMRAGHQFVRAAASKNDIASLSVVALQPLVATSCQPPKQSCYYYRPWM